MRRPRRWLAGALLAAGALLGGAAYVGYSSLELTEPQVRSVAPAITGSALDLFEAAAKLAGGDLAGAAAAAIEGLDVRVSVGVHNASAVPVFLPSATHVLLLNGVPVTGPFASDGGWIGPRATLEQDITSIVPFENLPRAVVAVVVDGGGIEIRVRSTLELLVLGWTIVTPVTRYTVTDALRGILPGV